MGLYVKCKYFAESVDFYQVGLGVHSFLLLIGQCQVRYKRAEGALLASADDNAPG